MKTKLAGMGAMGWGWLAGGLLGWAADGAPETTAVFQRYFDAVGGRPKLEQVKSLVVEGTGWEGTHEFKFELSLKTPGLLLLAARNDRGFEVRQGRDLQARCWRQSPEGTRDLDPDEAGGLMDLGLGYHLPSLLALSERMAGLPVETVKREGGTMTVVGRADGKGPFPRFGFAPDSGLLVQVGKIRFDDYREVEGLRLPFAIQPSAGVSFEVTRIRINPALDDAVFDRPEGKPSTQPSAGGEPETAYQTLRSAPGRLEIVRRPAPMEMNRGALAELPHYDTNSQRPFQIDLRGADLSQLALSGRLEDLFRADFDQRTRWPDPRPPGFAPERLMELGRDPGLGVRSLHRRGITGKGVAIGVIDQALLVDHAEYRDQLRLYEEVHAPTGSPAAMHGPAVASIAVGKTVGIAPGADLYYVAEMHGTTGPGREFRWDFQWLAQAIDRLLEVNAGLPAERKLRVISISVGWAPSQAGYREVSEAVKRASDQGVFVISTAIETTHGLAFHGLGREPLGDPNDFSGYRPGYWWADSFRSGRNRFLPGKRLLVPMDCRTTASPTGPDEYVYYWGGGWSWSVPWIAGLYALACQVDPAVTPERFWREALETGRTIRIQRGGADLELGTIADPVALVAKLDRARRAGGR